MKSLLVLPFSGPLMLVKYLYANNEQKLESRQSLECLKSDPDKWIDFSGNASAP
jgi:hypothetical protein